MTQDATTVPDGSEGAIVVEFLYSQDCPSHERALALLREVLVEEGITALIRIRQVETEEEAEQWRFPGSPTIRINGRDIEENPDLPVALACRAYRHESGRISPLPPRDKITAALRTARLRSDGPTQRGAAAAN